ncbi:MAG: metallophosphoesterase, partial [bacterium]
MDEFEFINIFYNMVYFNEHAYMRSFNMDSERLYTFRRWLEGHHIDIDFLNSISGYALSLLHSELSYIEMERLLHLDIQKDLDRLQTNYANKTHVIYIPSLREDTLEIDQLDHPDIMYFRIDTWENEDLVFFDPFPAFLTALLHADEWPGALVFTHEESEFVPIHSEEDFKRFNTYLTGKLFTKRDDHASYYFHLSDLHLNSQRKQQILSRLYDSLDYVMSHMHSRHAPKFLLSGDLMNSPNRKNMYQATGFMNTLKKRYHAKVCFVLGNHDMITVGFSIGGRQNSKVIAYLLEDKLTFFEDDHTIIIKIDSNYLGNFARGAIGERQLAQIDDELSAVTNIEDYTLVAMLHHHVIPVKKQNFLRRQWNEGKVLGFIFDETKALIDAEDFRYWLRNHAVRYVVHGHKHVPFFVYDDLSDEDKAAYENTFEDENGELPESIASSALNEWIFNEDTIKEVLHVLMTEGIKIDYGNKIGKT